MYKTILVPLDGSARAEQILAHVEDMASSFDASVVLLQVLSPIIPVMDPDAFLLELGIDEINARVKEAQSYLTTLQEKLTQKKINNRTVVFEDGRHLEQEISLRAYSLHEVGKLLHRAGFRVMEVSGHISHRGEFFGNESRSLVLLAEKRPD